MRGNSVANVNTDGIEMKKRSVILDGHATSVSVEEAFWRELKAIAKRRGCSLNALIGEIDHDRTGGLSSAIRLFVLAETLKR